MHYGLEMGVVLQGRMRRFWGEDSRVLRRGEPWFSGMWEPHGAEVVGAPCRVVVTTIWPPLLAGLHFEEAPELDFMRPFAVDHSEPLLLPPASKRELLRLAESMLVASTSPDPLHRGRLRLLLLEALTCVLPALKSAQPERTPRRAAIAPALELALTERRPVRVTEAARACHLGRERFMREFKNLMGLSFAQFALRKRLAGAAGDLATSEEPLKAIAWQWGFANESHFHRLFVRHYRATPAEYRKRTRSTGPAL
jgi:AraC-like DNA-binding protein